MTAPTFDYRPYDESRDKERAAKIISHAFASSIELCESWLDAFASGFRVLTRDGEVVATTLLYDCGQFFGGRSVGMQGVAGVTVAAEARGRGVARQIMTRCVLEMHELGAPLSTLYPATLKLYQAVGYEQAGHYMHYRIPTDVILERETGPEVSAMTPDDRPEVEALYRKQALHLDGYIDRDPWMWGRIYSRQGHEADGYVVREADGSLVGYAVLQQRHTTGDERTQVLIDVQFSTERAARRILRFMRDHSSTIRDIGFTGGPHHPFCLLLDEQRYEVTRKDYWMTRILDVPKAMGARGYGPGRSGRVELRISDELIPSNNGCWTLKVEGGRGGVSSGGAGAVALNVRDLAPIYTGLVHPRQLQAIGRIEGTDEDLALLGSLFAGTAPAMVEPF